MANYSEMTHAELATLCSKQQAHISSLNEQAIRMRHDFSEHTDKLVEENKKLRRKVNTMGEGEEAHLCKIASLKREIEEIKDEGGNYQYDLEELQADLLPLEEFMYDLTGVCNYEDLIDYIKGIQEKDRDYTDWMATLEEYKMLKSQKAVSIKQVSDLMEEVVQLKKVVQQRAFRIIELENDLESTTNYWKSKYENEEGVNQMLRDAIDVAAVKLEQYEAGDNSI